MVESAAEASEELMNKYLEEGDLTEEEITQGLRIRTINSEIQPMLCGTAFKNKGVQRMLDAVLELMPSPLDVKAIKGFDEDEKEITRKADDDEKFSALAFKLMTDPFVGQLTFVRVYSGVLKKGDTVYNAVRGKKERIGRIVQMHANNREEVDRRHRRLRGFERCHYWRNFVRPQCGDYLGTHGLPRLCDSSGCRA